MGACRALEWLQVVDRAHSAASQHLRVVLHDGHDVHRCRDGAFLPGNPVDGIPSSVALGRHWVVDAKDAGAMAVH
jgi:hypothetical protein